MRFGTILCLAMLSEATIAADEIGVFEAVHQSNAGYEETIRSVAIAFENSDLLVHASHEVRVPEGLQRGHIFVLTSPTYQALAKGESPRTISAQVLRVAVYTWGDDQQTLINMANPIAHAMVYYANSDNYGELLEGARVASAEIREALSELGGTVVSMQQEPMRSENHYRKYKGDGPARIMAKFRTFESSQLPIGKDSDADVASVAATISKLLDKPASLDASEPDGWQQIVRIPFAENAIYFGLSNAYIEDKMIRINSRFRSDGKSDVAPYPGVDHVAALPTDVLVIHENGVTKVLHYGQMWRMQLYFWDSGYRAFTANVGVPAAISNSIEDLLGAESE